MTSEPPAPSRAQRDLSALAFFLIHLGGAFSLVIKGVILWEGAAGGVVGEQGSLWVSLCLAAGLLLLLFLRLRAGRSLFFWREGRRASLFWGVGVALGALLCQLVRYWGAAVFGALLFWPGFLLLALLSLAPFFLFGGAVKKVLDRLLIALLFLLSVLLPIFSLLIALVLWFPEGFLGDPGRIHYLGISYGQVLAIVLGLGLARLYQVSEDGFSGRMLTFGLSLVLSVGASAMGLMALTVFAHPLFALSVAFLGGMGAFLLRSLVLGAWPVFWEKKESS